MSHSTESLRVDVSAAEGALAPAGRTRRWRWLGLGLSLVSLAVIGWFVQRAFQAGNPFTSVRWAYLGAAAVVQFGLVLTLPFLWEGVLRSLAPQWREQRHGRLLLLQAYGRSWLARYIPGKIWMFSGRLLLARPLGLSATLLARSMAFEVLFSYATLAVLGVSLILGWFINPWIGVLSGITTLVVEIGVLRALDVGAQRATRITARLPFAPVLDKLLLVVRGHPSDRPLARWLPAAYGLHAFVQLLFILLVVESFGTISSGQAVVVAGAWALSSVLGYLAFFAPGGLGVRDGLALGLMAPVLSAPEAGVVLAAARLIMIGADLAFAGSVEAAYLVAKMPPVPGISADSSES